MGAVFDSVRNNPKDNYDGKHFLYKDKNQLLELIRNPDGMPVIDLKDAYPNVMEDLQALEADSQILLPPNFGLQEDIAYQNDPSPRASFKVDDDLKQLFRGITLPLDMLKTKEYLRENKEAPATDTAKRHAVAEVQGIPSTPQPKKKKLGISKRIKLTNAYLPELIQKFSCS